MTFKDVINAIDENTYQSLKKALEIGKWPDGKKLDDKQQALTMQAIIAYEIENNLSDKERTGYVDVKQAKCDTKSKPDTLKWQ